MQPCYVIGFPENFSKTCKKLAPTALSLLSCSHIFGVATAVLLANGAFSRAKRRGSDDKMTNLCSNQQTKGFAAQTP